MDNVDALYWSARPDGKVICRLCPFNCVIKEGEKGVCRVKKNIDGRLIAVAYGLTTSLNFDPIEKKPLYHFYPGASILSVGINGCNFNCSFCQNFEVSQRAAPTKYVSPEQLAQEAKREGCIGIAYTYTEPLMWYEYVMDSARVAREKGLKTVLVTNGYLEPEPFDELLPFIDAFNIDIKSMDEDFYKKVCRGALAPVLRNLEKATLKAHVEVTNLVIPTLNDSDGNFERLADFLAGIDPAIPLHFSRYHPAYRMEVGETPAETLVRAAEIASRKLKHVYIGNIHLPEWTDSDCEHCGNLLVERGGFSAITTGVQNGLCVKCGNEVNIII